MDFRGAGQPFGGGHQAKACPVIAIQAAFRSGPDVTGAVLRQGEDDQVLQTVGCQVVAEAVLLGDTDAAPRQNQGSARTEPMPTIHHRFPRTPYRLKCEEYHGNRAGNSLALDPKRPKGSVAPRCTAVLGTNQSIRSYYQIMHIGLPEFIVAAVAIVLGFFGWLIFRPTERGIKYISAPIWPDAIVLLRET